MPPGISPWARVASTVPICQAGPTSCSGLDRVDDRSGPQRAEPDAVLHGFLYDQSMEHRPGTGWDRVFLRVVATRPGWRSESRWFARAVLQPGGVRDAGPR